LLISALALLLDLRPQFQSQSKIHTMVALLKRNTIRDIKGTTTTIAPQVKQGGPEKKSRLQRQTPTQLPQLQLQQRYATKLRCASSN
jgi:hypothetical protein